ncbi:hypothetical protein NDN08_001893 [Rhodosorus marinus]|uniref:Chromate transporter n=1 Tax=Rhodosorus marinus TaxID=101924 RepID=A0AAV8UV42_9RHOD|nr:hypothetical protein NDN08_001893 [Rhodosorus marinus]
MESDKLLEKGKEDLEKGIKDVAGLVEEKADLEVPTTADVLKENDVGKEEVSEATWRELARAFGSLGLVAFGGPVAHVALLHEQFVDKQTILGVSEQMFLELFSMCQALPGPSSTQLVTALGIVQAGWMGGLLSFFLFQLPGFFFMTFFGLMLNGSGGGVLNTISLFTHGLIAAAFAQVTIAAVSITHRVIQGDKVKAVIVMISTAAAVVTPPTQVKWMYPLLLAGGGLINYIKDSMSATDVSTSDQDINMEFSRDITTKTANILFGVFGGVTALLFLIDAVFGSPSPVLFRMFDAFWRMGALVFGGGQVVLPMMMNEVVKRGFLSIEVFLNGFALVQVMPGPMFNLAPFVGAAVAGLPGAFVSAVGMFGPGVLLVFAVLPFWGSLRKTKLITACLPGVTACRSIKPLLIWNLAKS